MNGERPDEMPHTMSLEEIMQALKDKRTRTVWGAWRYVATNFTLECQDERGCIYDVDLERCRTSAEVLDWIFQIHGKTWATAEILKDLLDALDDMLSPQATMCSFGQSKTIDPKDLLCDRPGYRGEA